MTPREAQLCIRTAAARERAALNRGLTAAWKGALWQRVGPKNFPALADVLVREGPATSRPRTLEEDIRRWEIFFAQAGFKRQEAN